MVDIYSLGGVVFSSSNGIHKVVEHNKLLELKQEYEKSLLPHPNTLLDKNYFITYFAENYPNLYVIEFDTINQLRNGDKDYLTLIDIKDNVVTNIVTFRYAVNEDYVYIGMIDNDEIEWFDKTIFGKDEVKDEIFYIDCHDNSIKRLIQLKDI